MNKKHFNFKVYSIFITAAVVIGVILLNTIAGIFLASHPVKADLTKSRVYTLSDRTKEVVKNLKEPVFAYVLFSEEMSEEYYHVKDIMEQYDALGDNFKVSYRDPYADYDFLKEYTEKGLSLSDGTIIIRCGEKLRTLYVEDFYTGTYGEYCSLERMLTAAIARITGEDSGKIYFVTNHGEEYSDFASFLEANMLDWALLDLDNLIANSKVIPRDADMIIVIAPQYDFSETELALIDGYLEDDGKAIFSFYYNYGEMPLIYSYLSQAWGLEINHQSILEGNKSYTIQTQNGEQMDTAKLQSHITTDRLISRELTYVDPQAMPIGQSESNANYATVTSLAKTSSLSMTPDGEKGPFDVAAISETTSNRDSKVMIVGSVISMVDLSINQASNLANGDFILNAIDYMTSNESSMDIRSKDVSTSSMTMTQTQVNVVYYLLKLAIPLVIIALGIIIWLRRRYK